MLGTGPGAKIAHASSSSCGQDSLKDPWEMERVGVCTCAPTRALTRKDGFANHMAALEYILQEQLPLPKRVKKSTQRRDRHSLDWNLETRGET